MNTEAQRLMAEKALTKAYRDALCASSEKRQEIFLNEARSLVSIFDLDESVVKRCKKKAVKAVANNPKNWTVGVR